MTVKSAKSGVFALAVTVGLAGMAEAQTTPRNQQGLVRPPAADVTVKPKEPVAPGSADDTALLPALAGVLVVSSPSQVAAKAAASGAVAGAGATVPKSVLAAAQRFVGKPVSLASLDQMTAAMVLAYRGEGLPIVNVVVPPQDITDGVVQVVAVVGKLGKVTVSGGNKPKADYLRGFALSSGDTVTDAGVLDHLRWQSRRSNRRVDAVYAAGAGFGQTDIELDVTETKAESYFLGMDTSGNGGVGDYRFFGGFSINDFGGRTDHEVSGQITTSEESFDGLTALALRSALPIGARQDLKLGASFSQSAAVFGAITSKSTSLAFDGGIQTQLKRGKRESLDLSYGVEVKNADGVVEFGTATPVSNKETTLVQAYAQLGGQMSGAGSSLQYSVGVWLAPGGIGDRNTDAAFDAARVGATAGYAVARGSVNYTRSLPKDWRLTVSGNVQLTNARLLPSEAFYLGGIDSVRGIDDGAASGDTGAVGSLAVYTPDLAGQGGTPARLYAFVDAGTVAPINAQALEKRQSAVAAGVGLDMQWGEGATLDSSVGWPVSTTNIDDQEGPHVNLRLISRF